MKKIIHVLFHIDEEERWSLLCSNVRNILKKADEENTAVIVEIVANGDAVKTLTVDKISSVDLKENLLEFKNKGVYIYACESSLKFFSIDKSTLFSFVECVSSGVFHIALREQEGFSYIKP